MLTFGTELLLLRTPAVLDLVAADRLLLAEETLLTELLVIREFEVEATLLLLRLATVPFKASLLTVETEVDLSLPPLVNCLLLPATNTSFPKPPINTLLLINGPPKPLLQNRFLQPNLFHLFQPKPPQPN